MAKSRDPKSIWFDLFDDPRASNLNDYRLIRWECREAIAEGRQPYDGVWKDELSWNGQPLREYWAEMSTEELKLIAEDSW